MSNTDCKVLDGTTVCKQTVDGGAKTCQSAATCTQDCPSGEFCDSENVCQYGLFDLFYTQNKTYYCLVLCSVTSDCSTVSGLTSCKELITGNPLTCQAPSSCLATTDCSKEEYCTADNICLGAGT